MATCTLRKWQFFFSVTTLTRLVHLHQNATSLGDLSHPKPGEVEVTAPGVWMTPKGGDALNHVMSMPCTTIKQKHCILAIWHPHKPMRPISRNPPYIRIWLILRPK